MGEREKAEKRRRKKEARVARRAAELATRFRREGPALSGADVASRLDEELKVRSEQLGELADELLSYLDHLHADLRAIRAHLGIADAECAELAPEYEDDE